MTDLERRLHEAAMAESATYVPSADLPDRIQRRVRARRRRTRALAGGAAALGAAVVAAISLQLPGDDEQGVVANDPSSTTTSTVGSTTTTPTTTSTTTTTPPASFDARTPLNAKGVGPIEAGMTVAEAEAASGLSLTAAPGAEGFTCNYVDVEGQPDLAIRVTRPEPGPIGGAVIEAITIFGLDPDGVSPRRTTAGIGLGATEAQVRAAHVGAVDEQPHVYDPEGAYLYVYPDDAPGFGIRYVIDGDRVVTSIDVGDALGITAPEGCA